MDVMTLGFNLPGNSELLIILAIGLLLFGKRLPEVGRSLGKGITEFKRGLKDINDDIETGSKKVETSPKAIEEAPAAPSLPTGDARRVSHLETAEEIKPASEPNSNG
ncbi:MAG: twin-arginine translocase TatA/TatE family subunit [Phycisphaerales bacterium JB054]